MIVKLLYICHSEIVYYHSEQSVLHNLEQENEIISQYIRVELHSYSYCKVIVTKGGKLEDYIGIVAQATYNVEI